jgi:NTP pyrophosphatase (non-canonical NTP hydrolase)
MIDDLQAEIAKADARYGLFHSSHEGLGVLTEEFHELIDAIRSNSLAAIEAEAIQVAAVAMRLAMACRGEAKQAGEFAARSVK